MKKFLPQQLTREQGVFLILLLSAAAVRIHAAWFYRHTVNVDAAVVAMMAKDIAEGSQFPTFFYGQPHMGSLEPFLSAGFCLLFGVSGFAVNLGTALVSLGVIPVVYFWARQVAGPKAGVIASACCIVGPLGFFHYNGSPRGGYAAALTFGGFVLMYATRMALKWKQTHQQTHRDFFLLGLMAGIAWWSSQLTTAALGAAALLLLCSMGWHAISLRIATGLGGFLLGSFPLWLYNLRHEWATFNFADSVGSYSISTGLRRLFFSRVGMLFLPEQLPAPARILLAIVCLGMLLLGWIKWFNSWKGKDPALFWTFNGMFLFAGIFSILFTQSHLSALPTPRYLLPFVAPFAVWCGILLADPPGKQSMRILRGFALVILIGAPSLTLLDRSYLEYAVLRTRQAHTLATNLRPLDLEVVYTPVHYRSWNFILDEEFAFVALNKEVFPGNAEQAEYTTRMGVLDDYGFIHGFLSRSGIQSKQTSLGPHTVLHSFEAPPPRQVLQGSPIASIQGPRGNDVTQQLTSGDLSTSVEIRNTDQIQTFVIRMKEPTELSGIRLWPAREDLLPQHLGVDGQLENGEWISLSGLAPLAWFFWSHERIYWGAPFYRIQCGFDPVALTALRIHCKQDTPDRSFSLTHLDLLHPGQQTSTDLKPVLHFLQSQKITSVVADRGESSWLSQHSNGDIQTIQPTHVFQGAADAPWPDLILPAHSAWIVREQDAAPVVTWLATQNHQLVQTDLPGFTVWTSSTEQIFPGWIWTGCSLHAHTARQGQLLWEEGKKEEALLLHPWLAQPEVPMLPLDIQFENEVECLGLTLSSGNVRPGDEISLISLWRLPETPVDVRNLSMFAHWVNASDRIVSDQALLDPVSDIHLEIMPDHRTYAMTRTFVIPDVPDGTYALRFGLYRPSSGHRFEPSTDLPSRKGAVEIPLELSVSRTRGQVSESP